MRLSTKGRYAVMAMADLAAHTGGEASARAITLAEIAGRQQISLAYLEQLFARLRRAGLVRSARGPGGGYRLAKAADETRISEIVLAADEPIRATRCTGEDKAAGCMASGEQCLTHGLWEALGNQIERYLDGVSLDDVIQRRFDGPAARTAANPQAAA
ncbi:MAG TPA: Rrf2 family transcriptional regulator [Caulobacteraceae bacterium]|jgi:Rrf2 family iron-sulfur cluster assembly transcriptional regulator|nr:Rrf2 family transcriptional regulator [Caulobacteraceae bacterium]